MLIKQTVSVLCIWKFPNLLKIKQFKLTLYEKQESTRCADHHFGKKPKEWYSLWIDLWKVKSAWMERENFHVFFTSKVFMTLLNNYIMSSRFLSRDTCS